MASQDHPAAVQRGWLWYKVLLRNLGPNHLYALGAFLGVFIGAFLEGVQDGRKAWRWMWTR